MVMRVGRGVIAGVFFVFIQFEVLKVASCLGQLTLRAETTRQTFLSKFLCREAIELGSCGQFRSHSAP